MRRTDLLLLLLLALGLPGLAQAADPATESKALFDAESERGLRDFNAALLSTGSVPPADVEAYTNGWIAARQAGPP